MHMRRQAFSLVELSIVLVILGLLVGGILAGQSLIRASELRAVSVEYNRYVTAVQAFRDKYLALPGDYANASAVWGLAAASNCYTAIGTGTQTCNGNGDGLINSTGTNSNESYRLWQHLANAGLIEGTYSGVDAADNGGAGGDTTDCPLSKTNALWYTSNFSSYANGVANDVFALNYGNVLQLGKYASTAATPNVGFVKPEEMWNIDTKMDDGAPASGKLVTRRFNTCTNAAGVSDYAATYSLTSTSQGCTAVFRNAF